LVGVCQAGTREFSVFFRLTNLSRPPFQWKRLVVFFSSKPKNLLLITGKPSSHPLGTLLPFFSLVVSTGPLSVEVVVLPPPLFFFPSLLTGRLTRIRFEFPSPPLPSLVVESTPPFLGQAEFLFHVTHFCLLPCRSALNCPFSVLKALPPPSLVAYRFGQLPLFNAVDKNRFRQFCFHYIT